MAETDSTAVTEGQGTPTVLRTRIYRVCPTPDFIARLAQCRDAQRAVYNLVVASLPGEGGPVPATMSSPGRPNAFYGQLTRWRAKTPWLASIPVALARPAVAQARAAMDMHEAATQARSARLLGEAKAWEQWTTEHPDFDPGAWDALDIDAKRTAVKAGEAPPKSASTWRDERNADGSRRAMFRRKKTSSRCAVAWLTPPGRVSADTLSLPGLPVFRVMASNGLPEASRLRSARVCVKHGTRGRRRFEVHLSVRVDVVQRTRRPRKVPRVAGADMGCADTLTMHNGHTLALPDHGAALDCAVNTQRAMSKCTVGSRRWREQLDVLRREKAAMQARDCDAIRKAAKALAAAFDVMGLEALNITGMGASARGRSWSGVAAKRSLNHRIRAALWGFTQNALAAAFEARGGQVLKLPAMDSSRTCSTCGHVDAENRNGTLFRCIACGHRDNADVNAARNLRARALRYLALKADGLTDGKANNTLWKDLRAARKQSEKERAGGAGARNKPARNATSANDNGGAGAPSTALAQGPPTRRGVNRSDDVGPESGHQERLSV